MPLVCDPHFSLGHNPPLASDFAGSGPTRFSSCDPAVGDRCNAVLIAGAANTPFSFGRVVGVNQGSTGLVVSAACNGPCGTAPSSPVDVVLVIDRTSSMNGTDTTNAKAAANSLVGVYDPAQQWLALGTLGPSTTSGGCVAGAAGSIGTATAPADLRRWVPVGLSGVGSSVSSTYANISAAITCYPNSSTGTDLADPMTMAAWELTHNGRTGVRKGIIFETDGQPNAAVGAGPNYCALASAAATAAKAQNIEIFTIGFGLDAASGGDPACPDTSGAWAGKTATALLDNMATQPKVGTTTCDDTENNDDDHFFCIGKTGASTDLSKIFKAAATQLAKGKSHLVNLYPIPVVTAVSPSSGSHNGGTTVTVSGSFFTGATTVTFNGTSRPVHCRQRHDDHGDGTLRSDWHDGRHLRDDAGRDHQPGQRGPLHLHLIPGHADAGGADHVPILATMLTGSASGSHRHAAPRILLVDDDRGLLAPLAEQLRLDGFDVDDRA